MVVECIVGLKNALEKLTPRTLLIIDEADYCLLDEDNVKLPLAKNYKAIICFSASLPYNDSYDRHTLATELGLYVEDTHIPGAVNPKEVIETTFKDFLQMNPLRAKLVFTTEEGKSGIEELTKDKGLTPLCNTEELEKIQKLTSKDALIVTKEILMRGVDYRCETGIDLFMDASVSNERAYLQALGRVGRHDDPYARYVRVDLKERFKKKQLVLPAQTKLTF